ncbi:phiSA1p31-related protein [Streptomyces sp. NBC_00893]|uniref:phiSA1p31-related protein n=1 Tax=Streptomyces sp. NBC_00893 TaxID=2975862 RepID=UPI00224D7FE6|nr:phiSA1p31-related protein [Streptomyces sp. NBC_00893]MCX4849787.1 phiSA1p31-related protein [Streptomyces sp. NBC_00893]
MTPYSHDGVTFDLDVPYADVLGVEWVWTGGWADGEPLLRCRSDRSDCQTAQPLPTVYRDHGPLIPISRPTVGQYRAAVDPDYEDTVRSGYVETPAAFGARIAAQTIPQASGRVLAPSPLEQTGFRAFIRSLKEARNA